MHNQDEQEEQNAAAQRDWIKIGLAVLIPLLVHGLWFMSRFKEMEVDLRYSIADRKELHEEQKDQNARLSRAESIIENVHTRMEIYLRRTDRELTDDRKN